MTVTDAVCADDVCVDDVLLLSVIAFMKRDD